MVACSCGLSLPCGVSGFLVTLKNKIDVLEKHREVGKTIQSFHEKKIIGKR